MNATSGSKNLNLKVLMQGVFYPHTQQFAAVLQGGTFSRYQIYVRIMSFVAAIVQNEAPSLPPLFVLRRIMQ